MSNPSSGFNARLACGCKRMSEIHFDNLAKRLDRIELMMERLERRLWLTVYGVAAVIIAQAVQGFLVVAP